MKTKVAFVVVGDTKRRKAVRIAEEVKIMGKRPYITLYVIIVVEYINRVPHFV
jgi:hypothetical protein